MHFILKRKSFNKTETNINELFRHNLQENVIFLHLSFIMHYKIIRAFFLCILFLLTRTGIKRIINYYTLL